MAIERSIGSASPQGLETFERVKTAGIELFGTLGFHGTSIRKIADAAGLQIASLYHYFPSKYDLLVWIVDDIMGEGTRELGAAVAGPGAPHERLSAAVRAYSFIQMRRQLQSFVMNSELRSLKPEDRARHIEQRDQMQRMFDGVVDDGVAAGDFTTPYPVEASRAIVTMCTAISGWYRSSGPLEPDAIADRYATIALDVVEWRGERP